MEGKNNMAKQNAIILFADDNAEILRSMERALRTRGLKPDLASNPDEAVKMARAKPYLAIITDLEFTPDGREGYDVLEQISDLPAVKILYTGRRDFETVAEGLVKGADHVVLDKKYSELMEILREVKAKEQGAKR